MTNQEAKAIYEKLLEGVLDEQKVLQEDFKKQEEDKQKMIKDHELVKQSINIRFFETNGQIQAYRLLIQQADEGIKKENEDSPEPIPDLPQEPSYASNVIEGDFTPEE